ncbi:peptide-methionine (S)-S-oxide reductase MsrA [Halodesulfovibrio spirochaetisodalis]|uniref:Peptide methionine sulfoxide reductase MsrA n=1 Tax=Halodesulfovibrio spirochaetisodalis TaxID=1560234 RepID=A0A1B7XFM3_9BACT|nr:peptide-methionine (S)-S-oxide reductase MsrA [Halodesulfovibrio spirochaetisodalis]OBQ54073.1 peptide methionine sulfoxide reductase [Halodesulfovibrio spirochaetisodalis]
MFRYKPSILTLLLAGVLLNFSTQASAAPQATAIFAGGCFWCMQPAFDKVPGVTKTIVGYTGGTTQNPTYEQVSTGTTGHFEAIKVIYDPKKVSYEKLLDVYWHNIDPFDTNGQFCDIGSTYRSAIFYENSAQEMLADSTKNDVEKRFKRSVATKVLKAGAFWPAEDYHQDYYMKNPVRYKFYRYRCGRDARLKNVWGDEYKH